MNMFVCFFFVNASIKIHNPKQRKSAGDPRATKPPSGVQKEQRIRNMNIISIL